MLLYLVLGQTAAAGTGDEATATDRLSLAASVAVAAVPNDDFDALELQPSSPVVAVRWDRETWGSKKMASVGAGALIAPAGPARQTSVTFEGQLGVATSGPVRLTVAAGTGMGLVFPGLLAGFRNPECGRFPFCTWAPTGNSSVSVGVVRATEDGPGFGAHVRAFSTFSGISGVGLELSVARRRRGPSEP